MIIRLMGLAAIAMVGVSPASWARNHAMVSVEDRQQIADLISQYAYFYDSKDVENFLGLFTQDCLFEMYAGSEQKKIAKATGHEELKGVTSQRLAMLEQKGIQSRHYQTNTVLTLRPDRRVERTTMLTGIYRDLFERTDSGWKFVKRSLFIDERSDTTRRIVQGSRIDKLD